MAFLAPVVWEVRTTGNSANGGGFDAVSGTPGTDYSQQDSAQITYTDLVIDAATNTNCTSAGNPFTSAHVGNIINVTSGTGFTVQRVQVISVAAGVATCDKSLGTLSSTGGNGKLGGALTTLAAVAALMVAGNTVYVKASGGYTTTSATTFSTNGTRGNPISIIGYTTTRGDNGQATITRSTYTSTSALILSGNWIRCCNIITDMGGSGGGLSGFTISGTNAFMLNCKVLNPTSVGFSITGTTVSLTNCWVTGATSAATAAFSVSGNGYAPVLVGCVANSCSCTGFLTNLANTTSMMTCIRCISANNSGNTGYHGFKTNASQTLTLLNCIAYNNGGNGIFLDTTTNAAAGDHVYIQNCIIVSNGLYGINSNGVTFNTSGVLGLFIDNNASYNNSSGARNGVAAGPNDVTLTADPFTNGAAADFSLNNTSGAGAACRAAGFPGPLQAGGTGYEDLGALQHQDAGGGGTTYIYPIFD